MRMPSTWKRLVRALHIALSLASALQAQTPTLSKEYIRLGGRILAIEQTASPGYVAPVYQGCTPSLFMPAAATTVHPATPESRPA